MTTEFHALLGISATIQTSSRNQNNKHRKHFNVTCRLPIGIYMSGKEASFGRGTHFFAHRMAELPIQIWIIPPSGTSLLFKLGNHCVGLIVDPTKQTP